MEAPVRHKRERAIDRGRREARAERAASPILWLDLAVLRALPLALLTGWGAVRALEGEAFGAPLTVIGLVGLAWIGSIAYRDFRSSRRTARRRLRLWSRRRECRRQE